MRQVVRLGAKARAYAVLGMLLSIGWAAGAGQTPLQTEPFSGGAARVLSALPGTTRDEMPEADEYGGEPSLRDETFDQKTSELLGRYPTSGDAEELSRWRRELEQLTAQHFDARQRRQEAQLRELEARVGRLRELLGRRAAAKEQIVKNRVAQLTREAEGVGWGAPPNERSGRGKLPVSPFQGRR